MAPDHDHVSQPGYVYLHPNNPREKVKLQRAGTKFGSVIRFLPDKCAHEVAVIWILFVIEIPKGTSHHFSIGCLQMSHNPLIMYTKYTNP